MLERTDLPEARTRGEELLALLDGATITPQRLETSRIEVIRPLTADDLLGLDDGVVISGPTSLQSIRHAHHRVAQLLVEGAAPARVSLITGYSPGYVLRLQGDPVFKELLAYYAGQAEAVTVDIRERLTTLGLSAMDEVQRRFEEKPEEFTKRDLMEIIKQAVPVSTGTGPSGPPAPPVSLNVQFVTAQARADIPTPIIDATATRVPPEQEI